MSERHEVRVRGTNSTIVFIADSADGRLMIRQEHAGQQPTDVCSISLSHPDELSAFFSGLQRVVASLGQPAGGREGEGAVRPARPLPKPTERAPENQDREALVAQARTRNPQAFAPWTREEEEEIRQRHARGESIQTIARARRRSPRAIELRLQRLGVVPPEQ